MKATVVNTVANTTQVVELPEAVTNLADLKHFLSIDEGQFFEGTTHTDLSSDSQVLPVLPESKRERGYVFFVSPAQNKIKNGAYSRKECYALVKELSLQDAVKEEFGRNFTQVATDALNSFIAAHNDENAPDDHVPSRPVAVSDSPSTPEDSDEGEITTEKELLHAIVSLLNIDDDTEYHNQLNAVIKGIDNVFPNPYSVQDLANMRG